MKKVTLKVRPLETICAADVNDHTGNVRIHLNTERQRVCEAWFVPGMAGVDSAGLGEVLQNVLARFSDPEKERLAKVRTPCS